MEATKETGKNPAGAQSRAGEAGANLSVGLAAEKQQETAWNNFWRESEPKERELFEKSYSHHKLSRHHGGTGEYEHRYVEHCWHGWMDRAFLIYIEAANVEVSSRADHFATENPAVARSAAP